MNPTATLVEVRWFSPFDIYLIPEHILETVYEQDIGTRFRAGQLSMPVFRSSSPDELQMAQLLSDILDELPLAQLLSDILDESELKNSIRRELIKYLDQ